jgi:hypothetical protein
MRSSRKNIKSRKGGRGGKTPNKLAVDKQQVKQMIASANGTVTKKYLNSVIAATIPAIAGTLVQPALPVQGSANGQREGDSLAIDHIQVKFIAYNPETAIGVNNVDCLRLICLQSRAGTILTTSYSSAPATGVLDLGATGAIDESSFINFNAANETFHVLMDKSFPVNFGSANGAINHTFTLKPKVSKVNFTPGTTTALCGPIFWILQTASAALTLLMEQRLVYHDL